MIPLLQSDTRAYAKSCKYGRVSNFYSFKIITSSLPSFIVTAIESNISQKKNTVVFVRFPSFSLFLLLLFNQKRKTGFISLGHVH